ncbi:glycosyltransferase family 2 protein [Nubsella zeaxanthinifaciens]|jgi:glycosyltransferase involved in cell wall biosynthesis|uniref:glycosyltransferase family 2 protein n=1 Tax=Nubsella zeaxanthinifaciens TaxID=392412 RepID=UPI000DE22C4D|nr:glycosyltransferase [Nubsella zeaxanthinifaciens]
MPNISPKISVVLPVYNGSEYLEIAINSVIKQNLQDFEFIICDDCSTDNSMSIIKAIIKDFPNRITLLQNQTNQGLFKTLNLLLSNTSAPYIHLWAQDDIMKPDCLEKVLNFHLSHPEISMSYHQVNYVNEKNEFDNSPISDGTPSIIDKRRYTKTSAYWGCMPGNIANVTLTKNAIINCGLFNHNFTVSGDFEYWTRLVNFQPIGYLKEPLIFLRRHEKQLSRKPSSILYAMKEDIPIHKNLIDMADPADKKAIICAWRWKTQVRYLNEALYLISRRENSLARQCLGILNAEFNLVSLSLRWALIKVMKLLKCSNWFYKNVLKTLI